MSRQMDDGVPADRNILPSGQEISSRPLAKNPQPLDEFSAPSPPSIDISSAMEENRVYTGGLFPIRAHYQISGTRAKWQEFRARYASEIPLGRQGKEKRKELLEIFSKLRKEAKALYWATSGQLESKRVTPPAPSKSQETANDVLLGESSVASPQPAAPKPQETTSDASPDEDSLGSAPYKLHWPNMSWEDFFAIYGKEGNISKKMQTKLFWIYQMLKQKETWPIQQPWNGSLSRYALSSSTLPRRSTRLATAESSEPVTKKGHIDGVGFKMD